MARQRLTAKRNRRHRDHLECLSASSKPLELGIEAALPDSRPHADSPSAPSWRDVDADPAGRTVIEIDIS
jgi:hypothetical protein